MRQTIRRTFGFRLHCGHAIKSGLRREQMPMKSTRVFLTIVLGFGVALLAFAAIFLGVTSSVRGSEEAIAQVVHKDYEVIRQARVLRTHVLDAETGIRGFGLTRRREFLGPYETGIRGSEEVLAWLRDEAAADPARVRRVDHIASLLTSWKKEIALPAVEHNDPGMVAARADRGRELMDELRVAISNFENGEEQERYERLNAAMGSVRGLPTLLWGGFALALIVTVLLAWVVARHLSGVLTQLADAAHAVAAGEREAVELPRGDITPVSAAFEKMVEQLAEQDLALSTLTRASRLFSERVHLNDGLANLVGTARAYFPVTHSAIYGVTNGTSKLLARWPWQEFSVEEDASKPSVFERVLAENVSIVVSDPQEALWREDARARAAGVKSYAVIPLVVAEEAIGLLIIGAERAELFTPAKVEFLHSLGHQISGHVLASRLFAELQVKSEELVRSSQLKSDFLAMMSHELRTPLNAIIGFSEVLTDEIFGPLNARQQTYVANVLQAGRHLLALINDVLDLSKVEAGRMEMRVEECSARELADAAVTMVQPLAEKKQLKLTVEGRGRVRADSARTRQVLYNLLSNAVKFTPENGAISVTVEERNADVRFSVRDTGIGIASEDLSRLFSSFTQLQRPEVRSADGTGLGLALSRRLVELQGGTISVESEPGVGSVFSFTVPRARGLEMSSLSRSVGDATAADSHRVLIIDDDPRAREIFALSLRGSGFEVVECDTGEEGVAAARELQPAAIILDIVMPGLDGWDVLRVLRNDARTRSIPIVVASIKDERETGFVLGATDYLVKPVRKEALLEALQRCGVQAKPATILAVDDDPAVLQMYEALLSPSGCRVIPCQSSVGAVERIKASQPDVVLLDLMMPEVSGFQVLAEIGETPELERVPVIVVTAKDLSFDERAFLDRLADAVIEKGAAPREKLGEYLLRIVNRVTREAA
jgi:signal transduction histidine kinase/DNA-binding response OmpR family regulator/CHASE3 domain sensor protein